VEADGQRYRVVGVVENVPYFRLTPFADICVPISTNKTDDYKKQFFGGFMATLLARRPEEVKKIQVEFREMLPRVENPDPRRFDVVRGSPDNLIGLLSRLVFNRARDITESHTAKLMAWLTGFAVLFMVLPAINLMNINVSRIVERASQIGVRKAFGATSRSLVAQFVVENVLLTLIGGALGLVFSLLVLHTLEAIEVVRYAQFRMNYRVFAAGFAMTLFFGVFSGVYPAWKMSRLHPVEALKGAAL
jgi:putative ABC transport system permease protein